MIYSNSVAAPRQELNDVVMEGVTQDSQFIAPQVLPPIPLKQITGHYPKITISDGDLLRAAAAKRQPGASFDRWAASISDGTITMEQLAEELPIPDETSLVYEDYFPLEATYAKESGNRLKRANEVLTAATVMNASNFDAVAAGVAYTTANKATISFVEDIVAAILRCKGRGEVPNTIVLNELVYNRIRTATLVREFVAGANQPGAIVSPNTLQRAFAENGIEKVLIGGAYVNYSAKGKNDNIIPCWGSTYVWVGSVKEGQLMNGGAGRTAFWEKEGPLYSMFSYRDEPKASNVIRAKMTSSNFVSNARAGTLITTSYA
jgi:hypothetical protein